jgi:hypothetical protein
MRLYTKTNRPIKIKAHLYARVNISLSIPASIREIPLPARSICARNRRRLLGGSQQERHDGDAGGAWPPSFLPPSSLLLSPSDGAWWQGRGRVIVFKSSDLSRFITIYQPYRSVHTDKDHPSELHD